jgi:hypothetical protein
MATIKAKTIGEKVLSIDAFNYESSVIISMFFVAWGDVYAPHDTNSLQIGFRGGRHYVYRGVPTSLAINFMNSESWGKFFNENIRDKYEVKEVGK